MSGAAAASATAYFNHFEGEYDKLLTVNDRLHQKILAVTYIDALARGRYPNITRPNKRFVRLITDHSDWLDAHRVSPSQFLYSVANNKRSCRAAGRAHDITSRRLMRTCNRIVRQRRETVTRVSEDPPFASLAPQAQTNGETYLLEENRHSVLLSQYRNRLVHEFREPGYGTEFRGDGDPFYHWRAPMDGRRETEELVYPRKWLVGLIVPILSSLRAHYRTRRVAPHSGYDFGSHWHERRS
jgi:hypothetical protein